MLYTYILVFRREEHFILQVCRPLRTMASLPGYDADND